MLKKASLYNNLIIRKILPILKYYQKYLKIDYIFGSKPHMNNKCIDYISPSDFPDNDFKYQSCQNIIKELQIKKENVYGVGDSAVDIKMLSLAETSFAVNPKGNLEKYVNYVIKDDIQEIIKYLEH